MLAIFFVVGVFVQPGESLESLRKSSDKVGTAEILELTLVNFM